MKKRNLFTMKQKYIILSLSFMILLACQPLCQADEFPVVVEAEIRAVLSAEQEGVLSSLNVDTGSRVKKGETLAVVFHNDLILKKEQNEYKKQYLIKQVENLGKLNEKKLITDEELARAKMELAVNDKEVSIFETYIEHSKIRSPFSGVVVTRHIQPHEWVKPGQPVVELYNPDKLRIVSDIPSEIALSFKSGESHILFFPDLKKDVAAKLKLLAPQVDVRSNTIKVYWQVGGKQNVHLLPGMKGVLKIEDKNKPSQGEAPAL